MTHQVVNEVEFPGRDCHAVFARVGRLAAETFVPLPLETFPVVPLPDRENDIDVDDFERHDRPLPASDRIGESGRPDAPNIQSISWTRNRSQLSERSTASSPPSWPAAVMTFGSTRPARLAADRREREEELEVKRVQAQANLIARQAARREACAAAAAENRDRRRKARTAVPHTCSAADAAEAAPPGRPRRRPDAAARAPEAATESARARFRRRESTHLESE